MSASVFASERFLLIQDYQSHEGSCAIPDDPEKSERNKSIIQDLVSKVLEETKEGIGDEHIEAYQSFLSNVEAIDGEYCENPFSGSIALMKERLAAYEQKTKDAQFEGMVEGIQRFNFAKGYSPETVERMTTKLASFVDEFIDDRLPSLPEPKKRKAYETANEIEKIGNHVQSAAILELAERLKLAVLQSKASYRTLLSEEPIAFANPEEAQNAASRINTLISNLSPHFPKILGLSGRQLLDRLYEADAALIRAGILTEKSPIAEAIELLETALGAPPRERVLPKTASDRPKEERSKVALLASRFEDPKEPVPTRTVGRPSPAPAKVLSPEEKQVKFLSQVQEEIRNIDPTKGVAICQLKRSLEENKELFSPDDQKGIDQLIGALEKLRDPSAFRPSDEEGALRKHWKGLLSPYGTTEDSYERTIRTVQGETKNALDRLIKENCRSFSELNTALERGLPCLETQAISQRFIQSQVRESQTKSLSPNFALNLANTIRHFEAFKHEAESYLDMKWTTVVARNDRETGGKFSEIIEHLGYCNLAKRRESICLQVMRQGMRGFMTDDLFEAAESQTPEVYGMSLERLKSSEVEFYREKITEKYKAVQPKLQWIREHIGFIKVVYDQGSDFNRNMGSGTCERNSEDRIKLLLRSPHTPSERIVLGSTQTGRFNQAIHDQIFAMKDRDPEGALQLLQDSYKRVGLHLHQSYPVPVADGQDPQEALCHEIGRINADEKETLFILELDGRSPVGHAINVQVDLSKPIYRFIDDNIGTIECPDAEKFAETLSSWLKIAYPDLTNYTLSVFRPISS